MIDTIEIKEKIREYVTLRYYLMYIGFSSVVFAFIGKLGTASFLMALCLFGLIVYDNKKKGLDL